jgi:hypothetical protein
LQLNKYLTQGQRTNKTFNDELKENKFRGGVNEKKMAQIYINKTFTHFSYSYASCALFILVFATLLSRKIYLNKKIMTQEEDEWEEMGNKEENYFTSN